MRRWPRPVRIAVKAVVSVATIAMAVWLVPELGGTAYSMATLRPCIDTYAQIVADYRIAYQHIPPTTDPKVEAGYIEEIEHTLEDRTAALTCPLSVLDERDAFLAANRRYSVLMHTVAVYGIPKDQQAQALLWVQLRSVGNTAYDAQKAFEAALADEAERIYPKENR